MVVWSYCQTLQQIYHVWIHTDYDTCNYVLRSQCQCVTTTESRDYHFSLGFCSEMIFGRFKTFLKINFVLLRPSWFCTLWSLVNNCTLREAAAWNLLISEVSIQSDAVAPHQFSFLRKVVGSREMWFLSAFEIIPGYAQHNALCQRRKGSRFRTLHTSNLFRSPSFQGKL